MRIRIHHFFDIIRDIGSGKNFAPHPYQHSYHLVAQQIMQNPNLKIIIVSAADSVCQGCIHLKDNNCDDILTHRPDFTSKQDFNDYLDQRISLICKIQPLKWYTPKELCIKGKSYLEKIESIYVGNDADNTQIRKENVLKGVQIYAKMHGFSV
jgi:hypothetical protein